MSLGLFELGLFELGHYPQEKGEINRALGGMPNAPAYKLMRLYTNDWPRPRCAESFSPTSGEEVRWLTMEASVVRLLE